MSAPTTSINLNLRVHLHQLLTRVLIMNHRFVIDTEEGLEHDLTLLKGGQPRHYPHYDNDGKLTVYRIRESILEHDDGAISGQAGYSLIANQLYLPTTDGSVQLSSPVVGIRLA